eukprot:6541604-Karenia_brevis.AAC.1
MAKLHPDTMNCSMKALQKNRKRATFSGCRAQVFGDSKGHCCRDTQHLWRVQQRGPLPITGPTCG